MSSGDGGVRGDHPGPLPHSSSSSSNPCSSGQSASGGGADPPQCDADRMVKIEIDAARALADFAQLALLGSGGGEEGGKETSGRDGRRRRKRGKDGSPISKTLSLDLNKHADPGEDDIDDERNHEKMIDETIESTSSVKPYCSSSREIFSGGRAKQNLTEAEKEAKRLRRILANRESARQTIRRRQALREELSRKADCLSQENETMKREMDHARKEYLLLKEMNLRLKEKMPKQVKSKTEENTEVLAASQVCTLASAPSLHPLVTHSRSPFILLSGSPIFGPYLPKAHNSQSTNPGHEQGVYGRVNGPMPTYFMPSYPWFHPVMNQQVGSCSLNAPASKSSTSGLKNEPEQTKAEFMAVDSNLDNGKGRLDQVWMEVAEGHERHAASITEPFDQPEEGESEKVQKEFHPSAEEGVNKAAAAEARKRRKELTKLKRFCAHERQSPSRRVID